MKIKRFESGVRIINTLLALLIISSVSAEHATDLPNTSHDGLNLVENTTLRAVYMKPGATLDQYQRVSLLDCHVAFKKHWKQDYNREAAGLEGMVSNAHMKKMKERIAAEFKKIFTEELETKGGYEIVDDVAEDVLILKPAIINLDVKAPYTKSADMNRTFVASAGEMTLYLELYDSITNDIIARILDPEAARSTGTAQSANRVTNRQEEDRILRMWADTLRGHLGSVQGKISD